MRFTFSRGSAPGCSVDLVSVGPFPDGSALFGWRSTACRRSRTIALVMGLILHDGLLSVHARPRQHGYADLIVWFSAMRGQIHILDPAEGLGRPDWLMRRLIRPTLMYVRPRPHNCALVHMDSRIPRIEGLFSSTGPCVHLDVRCSRPCGARLPRISEIARHLHGIPRGFKLWGPICMNPRVSTEFRAALVHAGPGSRRGIQVSAIFSGANASENIELSIA